MSVLVKSSLPTTIELSYHTVDGVLIAQATSTATQLPAAAYSLTMMRAWLARHQYQYVVGSNGLWTRR